MPSSSEKRGRRMGTVPSGPRSAPNVSSSNDTSVEMASMAGWQDLLFSTAGGGVAILSPGACDSIGIQSNTCPLGVRVVLTIARRLRRCSKNSITDLLTVGNGIVVMRCIESAVDWLGCLGILSLFISGYLAIREPPQMLRSMADNFSGHKLRRS